MFHAGLRLWGAQVLTELRDQVDPLKKDPHGRGGEREGVGWERLDLSCFRRV